MTIEITCPEHLARCREFSDKIGVRESLERELDRYAASADRHMVVSGMEIYCLSCAIYDPKEMEYLYSAWILFEEEGWRFVFAAINPMNRGRKCTNC